MSGLFLAIAMLMLWLGASAIRFKEYGLATLALGNFLLLLVVWARRHP